MTKNHSTTDPNPIEIEGLHRICNAEWETAVQMMLRAFKDYPKLSGIFPAFADRQAGIAATLRYYGVFDLRYGAGFSLNQQIRECVLLMHAKEMAYSEARIRAAGCESSAWRSAMQRLDSSQWRYDSDSNLTEAGLHFAAYMFIMSVDRNPFRRNTFRPNQFR